MFNQFIKLISIIYSEQFGKRNFNRIPELAAMDNDHQVKVWHTTGSIDGPLIPIYFVTAKACSALVPKGGTVVDLGCGSGQFAAFFAKLRPDIKIIGLDLSSEMIDKGNESLKEEKLEDRVHLIECDMLRFSELAPSETTLVTSIFSLHHLPSLNLAQNLFDQVRTFNKNHGSSFFLFDLVRPKNIETAFNYPELLTPESAQVFKEDTINSLKASFTHEELCQIFKTSFQNESYRKELSRILPLYQSFLYPSQKIKDSDVFASDQSLNLSSSIQKRIMGLEFILPKTASVYKIQNL